MNDLHEWFQKNDLCPENILYLYRSDRKTVVHRMDGEEAALYAPLHSVFVCAAGKSVPEHQQGNCGVPQPDRKHQQRWDLHHV